jgi:hypothetical protein
MRKRLREVEDSLFQVWERIQFLGEGRGQGIGWSLAFGLRFEAQVPGLEVFRFRYQAANFTSKCRNLHGCIFLVDQGCSTFHNAFKVYERKSLLSQPPLSKCPDC